jgi:AcrR family transcriptional regulator
MGASNSGQRETGQAREGPVGAAVLTPSLPWDLAARSQRERILRAMAQSCAEKSFAGTTIADIVGKASISRATFYKHFANKTECFFAAAEEFLAELGETAGEAGATAGSGTDAVRAGALAVLERLARKPDHASLLLVETPVVAPEVVRRCRSMALDRLEVSLGGREATAEASPEMAFGRANLLIADQLAAGEAAALPKLLPELLYVALLPYVGHDEALDQARRIA